MSEEWRDIKNYEGMYQVSNMGRVKSLERKVPHKGGGERTVKERILKPGIDTHGYMSVVLCIDGKKRTLVVHRLVCEAFHEKLEGKQEVNHINEDKTDNRSCNLEWCSRRENVNFGTRNERMAKAKSKPVAQYALDGKLVKIWISAIEAKRQEGFNCGNISEVANGNRKTAHGFIWKYVSKEVEE